MTRRLAGMISPMGTTLGHSRLLDDAAAEWLAGVEIRWDAPLGTYTSMKVGGAVTALASVKDEDELRRAVSFANSARLPWLMLGAGSNMLVPDGRTEALAVRLVGSFLDITLDGAEVRTGAAVKCARLARRLAREGLRGFGFAAGIPGTVGGAVAMNAGYGGRSMADVVVAARLFRPGAGGYDVAARELGLGYRESRVRRTAEIVLRARLALERGSPESLAEEIRAGDAHRARTQPLSAPSCGSVFRNPPGDHAGRLIEAAGLKGARVGGAEVSTVHANFIVTSSGATCADVEALIERVRETVARGAGVTLEREVLRLSEALQRGTA